MFLDSRPEILTTRVTTARTLVFLRIFAAMNSKINVFYLYCLVRLHHAKGNMMSLDLFNDKNNMVYILRSTFSCVVALLHRLNILACTNSLSLVEVLDFQKCIQEHKEKGDNFTKQPESVNGSAVVIGVTGSSCKHQ